MEELMKTTKEGDQDVIKGNNEVSLVLLADEMG